jgi:hypothetical protein
MSEQQEQQMVGLLAKINDNVSGIREEMAGVKADVKQQGVALSEIRSDMKSENLPSRVALVERDVARFGKGLWVIGTAFAGLVAHTVWQLITGKHQS